MSDPSAYKILQVDPEAEPEVIEAAYRRLARKYHPDVTADPEARDRMVRINQAWEVLRDPIRRSALDRALGRAAADAARVAAADAQAQARGSPGPYRGPTAPSSPGAPRRPGASAAGQAPADPAGGQTWPIKGMRDTGGGFGDRVDQVSPNWTAGRSDTGGGYDADTMGTAQGEGSAGPPPGHPSGSVLTFGRYSGWSLGEVARKDIEYLEWLDRMPIGRSYQFEIDGLLRARGRRATAPTAPAKRGLFRRR